MDSMIFAESVAGWVGCGSFFVAYCRSLVDSNAHRTDPMTGLATRTNFERRASRLVKHPDQQVTCLFLDLNNLKVTNDSQGHAAGDLLLTRTAGALMRYLPTNAVIGRLGGDEFVAVWTGSPHRAGLAALAEEVDAAIGVAVSGSVKPVLSDLMRAADVMMYRRKKSGSSGFEVGLVSEVGYFSANRWSRYGENPDRA